LQVSVIEGSLAGSVRSCERNDIGR
jgi:hypothetical protein